MIATAIARLEYLCHTIPPLLAQISESQLDAKPADNKWSKKEIIGHLIDSATNNHQRFVRCQFEDSPTILYDQNNWNKYSFHQQIPPQAIVSFWAAYNLHLIAIIKNIPATGLQRECQMADGKRVNLAFLINDYVAHMEHHLRHVVDYV